MQHSTVQQGTVHYSLYMCAIKTSTLYSETLFKYRLTPPFTNLSPVSDESSSQMDNYNINPDIL